MTRRRHSADSNSNTLQSATQSASADQPTVQIPVSVTTDGITLHGTVTRPATPVATVLLLSGSGHTDRNGNSTGTLQTDGIKLLAHGLADKAIASLRIDKRGVGQSTSTVIDEASLTIDHYIEDACLWFDTLQANRDLPVYFAGHSEGALVALAAALQRPSASGFISITGTLLRVFTLLEHQLQKNLAPQLYRQAIEILNSIRHRQPLPTIPDALKSVFRPEVHRYLRSWEALDPVQLYNRLKIPHLLVSGTADIQIPIQNEPIQAIHSDLASVLVIDGMTHTLKTVTTSEQSQSRYYTDPSIPVTDKLIDGIVEFILHSNTD